MMTKIDEREHVPTGTEAHFVQDAKSGQEAYRHRDRWRRYSVV